MREINTRKNYDSKPLCRSDLSLNPFDQFTQWFDEAQKVESIEVNAMSLATSTKEGVPSLRTVLMKKFDANGIVFFSNYNSKKGRQISENPIVAVTFYWPTLVRQVCIEGTIIKVSREESKRYFSSRPRGSQLGAAVSEQDAVIPNREFLDNAFVELEKKYKGKEIPLPENWGGYRIIPHFFDFWQGRPDRLHDRFHYLLDKDQWKIVRISP